MMMQPGHHPSEDELREFSLGCSGDTQRIQAHLDSCEQCGVAMDGILSADSLLDQLRAVYQARSNPPSTAAAHAAQLTEVQVDSKPFDSKLIGTDLGSHRVVAVLGRGGMGIVYRAHDPLIDREVAVKVLHDVVSSDPTMRKRFLAEARSQGMLSHPNVVTVYGIEEVESSMFMTMEYLAGGSVDNQIRIAGPYHWKQATRIVVQACRGLAAAHSAGLIHRDIKPANLLISEEGVAKLGDFGIAKASDAVPLTRSNQCVGTPHFMSPEQCGTKSIDRRSDIYQLGATYFTLLTGRLPYADATSPIEAMHAHCELPPPNPRGIRPDLPLACANVVVRAMNKNPDDRYQSAEDMFADLLAALGDNQAGIDTCTEVSTPDWVEDGATERTRQDCRRPLGACLTLALVAVLALLGHLRGTIGAEASPAPSSRTPTSSSPQHRDPIRVGVLHSLSGTMADSESPVVDSVLLAIDEINADGGLLGRQIAPVIVDGKSEPQEFRRQASRLIDDERVATVFGCWTSASRKSVIPVFEQRNHLLIYPLQYEGMEQSPNVIYTGAAPNQQIIPAVKWAYAFQNKRRFFLVGSDYVFPHAANEIIRDLLRELGADLVGEEYIPLGSSDVEPIIDRIVAAKPDVILNTINGDSNVAFFRALRSAGITPSQVPTVSFSIGEVEIRDLEISQAVGDFACWTYFQSINSIENLDFVERFRRKFGSRRVVNDPMEAAYTGVKLWADAVRRCGSSEPALVRAAMRGSSLQSPSGAITIDAVTQHAFKSARIGQINRQGQFDLVWNAANPIAPAPFPDSRTEEQWESFMEDLYRSWGGRWDARPSTVRQKKSAGM